MRRLALALALLLAQVASALAHASLVTSDPVDGAVMVRAPAAMVLTFNEPVSPLAIRLIGPGGAPIVLAGITAENATLDIPLPAGLAVGTHVLSWRVASADSHPVGGTLVFSIGEPSAMPRPSASGDPDVHAALWATRLVIHVALLVGVGGVLFLAWFAGSVERRVAPVLVGLLAAGLSALPLSVALQGLDALDLPLTAIRDRHVVMDGLATAYGSSAITAAFALLAALIALGAASPTAVRALALAGLCAAGLVPALSGHASTAPPQAISRVALMLHGMSVTFWIGALLPLVAGVWAGEGSGIARFSRVIPIALLALLASGMWLMLVQLDRPDALWRTDYGYVLMGKIAAVGLLLGLGALNRYRLVPRFVGAPAGRRKLGMSIAGEIAIAFAILALVGLWRFTPPPRVLAAAVAPISLHLHGERIMADIVIARGGERGGHARLTVLDGEFRTLAVKEVTLVLANEAAGIEAIRRRAVREDVQAWRVDGIHVPLAGRWTVGVEVLVSDFERVTVEDTVALPRLP